MFLCRHDDTNTDIYLRRIDEKLVKLFEQFDKTPEEMKEYTKIEDETYRSRMIVACTLSQLELLKKGNLKTGLLASIIPAFLLNYDNQDFDRLTDVIICSLTEHYNYTKEEAVLLKKTLLERSMSANLIKRFGFSNIESNLYDVIKYQVIQVIRIKNNGIIPENLWMLLDNNNQTNDYYESEIETIMKAIDNGEINDIAALSRFIRKCIPV